MLVVKLHSLSCQVPTISTTITFHTLPLHTHPHIHPTNSEKLTNNNLLNKLVVLFSTYCLMFRVRRLSKWLETKTEQKKHMSECVCVRARVFVIKEQSELFLLSVCVSVSNPSSVYAQSYRWLAICCMDKACAWYKLAWWIDRSIDRACACVRLCIGWLVGWSFLWTICDSVKVVSLCVCLLSQHLCSVVFHYGWFNNSYSLA